jgi:hypothetical protein
MDYQPIVTRGDIPMLTDYGEIDGNACVEKTGFVGDQSKTIILCYQIHRLSSYPVAPTGNRQTIRRAQDLNRMQRCLCHHQGLSVHASERRIN